MSESRDRDRQYRRRVRLAGIGLRLARSSLRKRQSWFDRLLVRLLRKATAPADPATDYMRDEIVDAGIGFDADELDRYQASGER